GRARRARLGRPRGPRLRRQRSLRRLATAADGPHDQRGPRARAAHPGGDRRGDRRRHLHGDQPLLVDRRPPAQLPVRLRDRLRDQEREAGPHAQEPHLHRHRAAVLAVDGHALLGDRAVGPRQLRQGAAGPGRAHRSPRGARPVPRRAGGGAGMSAIADAAARAVEAVTDRLPGAEVVVEVERAEDHLTRFADSAIHQNVADDTWSVGVTAHHEGRTLTVTSDLAGAGDGEALTALAERLVSSLPLAPRDPRWPGVAERAEVPAPAEQPGTSPVERADAVAAFVDGAGGLPAFGYVRTERAHVAAAASGGQLPTMLTCAPAIDGIARPDGVDGVFRRRAHTLAELDPHAAGALAAAKARAAQDAVELEPGRYEVVLEPTAAANIVSTLALYGFNGRMALDGASFVEVGAEQLDPAITVVDDAPGWGVTIDGEGTPTQRHVLVDAGRSTMLAHDRRTAAEAGARSTGHGFGIGMPVPTH